jgi:hypothetical protein
MVIYFARKINNSGAGSNAIIHQLVNGADEMRMLV